MAVDSTNNIDTFSQLGLYREPEKRSAASELGQDTFLDLMLAQMQNQDPLDPMDNTQFVAQLAQFSTAQGIAELQGSFEAFSGSMSSNQALQASTLVGRTVSVPSETGSLPNAGQLEGEIELPASTTQMVMGVYDRSGQLVRRIDMGSHAAGSVPFSWDGTRDDGTRASAGTYEIRAEALIDGKATALDTSVYADVESVNLGRQGQGITLNLAGIGSVSFTDVKQIR